MPNWCQNQLTVTGATPEFRAWLEKEGFSFEKMNPPRRPRKQSATPWPALDSHYNAWGTKWDLPEDVQREAASDLLDHATAFFDTAWSPPMRAIEALSRKFPEVGFQLDYCEIGMFFAGSGTFSNGECHDDFHEEKDEVMKIACDIFGYEDEDEDTSSLIVQA